MEEKEIMTEISGYISFFDKYIITEAGTVDYLVVCGFHFLSKTLENPRGFERVICFSVSGHHASDTVTNML